MASSANFREGSHLAVISRFFTANLENYKPDSRRVSGGPDLEEDARYYPIARAESLFDSLIVTVPEGVSFTAEGVFGPDKIVAFMPQYSSKADEKPSNLFDLPQYRPAIDGMVFIFNNELEHRRLELQQAQTDKFNVQKSFSSTVPTVGMHFIRDLKGGQAAQPFPSESKADAFRLAIARTYEGDSGVRLIFTAGTFLGAVDLNFDRVPGNLIHRKVVNLNLHTPQRTKALQAGRDKFSNVIATALSGRGARKLFLIDKTILEELPSGYSVELTTSELSGTLAVHRSELNDETQRTLELGRGFLWESKRVYPYDKNPEILPRSTVTQRLREKYLQGKRPANEPESS